MAESDNPIFAIAEQAAAMRAAGVDVISLAAGEPEAATAPVVVEAAVAAARDPRTHHYGAAAGLPELRELVADRHRDSDATADRVQVALGTKHALHLALGVVAGPGDEVLVLRPSWPGHVAAVRSVGADDVRVPVGPDGMVALDSLERARTAATRAVVIANPSNPSGVLHPAAIVREIATWCREHGIWLVSDEVYGGLVFDGGFNSASSVVADGSRLLLVDGVSKVHAMTGWRVGWLVGPEAVIGAARRHVSSTITHVPEITQRAAIAALRDDDAPVRALTAYRRSRDLLVERLQQVPGVSCPVPAGGMFAFPDVRRLVADGPWDSSADLASWLLTEAHVAVVPGEVFGADGHLRISFAVGPARLEEAADRLAHTLTRRGH